MKRLLLDVNVVLDAIVGRAPHAAAAAALWDFAEEGRIAALVPAHGVTTIFYLLAKARDAEAARRAVESVCTVFDVAPVDRDVLRRALVLGGRDFEDAVCVAAAEAAGCELVVTRDPRDYAGAALPVVDPPTAVALLLGAGPGQVSEPSGTYGVAGTRRRLSSAAGSRTPRPRGRGRTRGSARRS